MIQLKPEVFDRVSSSSNGIYSGLQAAIELEHSTLPPYLYALYSLDPRKNDHIYNLFFSIVRQEMLHMSLACNVLNAINGSPVIDKPDFIPHYPGPLPGSVEEGLIVGLSGFTKKLVKETFMVIEEPEDPLHIPICRTAAAALPPTRTIGEFYERIKAQIIAVSKHKNIFKGDPRKQLTVGFNDLIKVTDVDSAVAAIDLIVEQGEGTKTSPLDPEHQPAHYYRFKEIYVGKTLRANPTPGPEQPPYVFGDPTIPFDETGVTPLMTNPKASQYPKGSEPFIANNDFNFTYTSLLKTLHRVFNGEPDRIAPAVQLMESMKQQALYLMTMKVQASVFAGPSFEYRPVN